MILIIIFAIVVALCFFSSVGETKSYLDAQDWMRRAWLAGYGTEPPEGVLSSFQRMMTFITRKETDHRFGGTAPDDYSPLCSYMDDFCRAVNYDEEKCVLPMATLLKMLDNTRGYPRAKKYAPLVFIGYMREHGLY